MSEHSPHDAPRQNSAQDPQHDTPSTGTSREGGLNQSASAPKPSSETVYRKPRRVVQVSIPDGWLRGALAGIQAALMGWGLSTVLVLGAFFLVSDNPWMGSITWSHVMAAGSSMWAMALGGHVLAPLPEGDLIIAVRAIPLLLTVMAVTSVRAFLRSSRNFPRASYLFAIPGFVATSAAFIAANHAKVGWTSTVFGATLICTVGVGWAWRVSRRAEGRPSFLVTWSVQQILKVFARFERAFDAEATVAALRRGVKAALWLLGGLSVAALVVLGIAALVNMDKIGGIVEVLAPATAGDTVMLWVAQMLYLPNAIAWVLAWGTGAGLTLGEGVAHSIGGAVSAPIPPIPLLGVLPGNAPGYWWITLTVLVCLITGAVWGWRARRGSITEDALSAVSLIGVTIVGVAIASYLSTLTLGAGRLSLIGPRVGATTGLILVEVVLPLLLGYLATHPRVLAWGSALIGGVGFLPPVATAEEENPAESAGSFEEPLASEDQVKPTSLEEAPETDAAFELPVNAEAKTSAKTQATQASSQEPMTAPTEVLNVTPTPENPNPARPTNAPTASQE